MFLADTDELFGGGLMTLTTQQSNELRQARERVRRDKRSSPHN